MAQEWWEAAPVANDGSWWEDAPLADAPKKQRTWGEAIADTGRSVASKASAAGDELGKLRDEFFTGVENTRAAGNTVGVAAQANLLQKTNDRLAELMSYGEGDMPEAQGLRKTIEHYNKRMPSMVSGMTEAQADAQRGAQMTTRPAVAAMNEAKSFGEAWEIFKKSPYDVIAGVTATSLPTMLPALVTGAALGPAAGAAAMGGSSAITEAGSSLAEFAREKGVNTTDQKAVEAFFSDRQNLADAMSYAGKRAGIIGALDAASGGMAGKTIAPAFKSVLAKQAVNMPAQMAVQAGLGAAGEAGGQLATKGRIDQPGQVLMEAVGELAGAPMEVAAFSKDAFKAAQTEPTKVAPADILKADTVDEAIETALQATTPTKDATEVGKQFQDLGIEPTGETSNIQAHQVGQAWQDIAPEQTGSLEQQRLEQERAGEAKAVETEQSIAEIGQQWQDLGITQPADDLQAQRTGMRPADEAPTAMQLAMQRALEKKQAGEPTTPAVSAAPETTNQPTPEVREDGTTSGVRALPSGSDSRGAAELTPSLAPSVGLGDMPGTTVGAGSIGNQPSSAAVPLADKPAAVDQRLIPVSKREPASWVIREKANPENVIMETFDKKKVAALNTAKYEAVPIQDYLVGINKEIKAKASRENATQAPQEARATTEPATTVPSTRSASVQAVTKEKPSVIAPDQTQQTKTEREKAPAKIVSTYTGKFGKGMNRDAARLEANRLNRTNDGITYAAEEHNDPKLENPYAVVGRKVAKKDATEGVKFSIGDGQLTYPLAPPGSRYEETSLPIKQMSPDEFLSQARPLDIDESSRDNIDDLKQHIKSGKKLDPLNLYADGKEDGRHRAHAAKELGITQVPVIDRRSKKQDPVAEAKAALEANGIKGKERLDVLKDVKAGTLTAEEVKEAYPVKSDGGIKFSIDSSSGEKNGLQAGTKQQQDLADKLAQRLNSNRPVGSPDRVLYAHSERVEGNETLSQSLAATKDIAKRLFGHEVVFVSFDGAPLFNGAMSTKIPGVVFINANAEKPHMAVLGHELLHTLRATNPSAYAALDKTLTKLLDADGVSKFLDKLEGQYKKQGMEMPQNWDEELFADVVGDNFMDPEFWNAMAEEQPSTFRRIANAVLEFLNNAIEKMTGSKPFGTDKMLTDVEAARDAVVQAMREYSGSQVGAVAESDNGERYSISPDQTDTAAFKKWFGDSKVVDADGNPLVVYHGTAKAFNKINMKKGAMGLFWMTSDKSAIEAGEVGAQGSGAIMPLYASIKNPAGWKEYEQKGIGELKRDGFDGIILHDSDGSKTFVIFEPTQVKSAVKNNGQFDPDNPDIRFSIAGQTNRKYTPEQLRAMKNVGFQVEVPTLKERAQALWQDAGKKMAQGIVDQFAPVKALDKEAYGLLRLSKGASGAFEAFLKGGRLKITDGVYDFDDANKGGVIDRLLMPLQGEHHDFMRWIAANRAERLSLEDREHLFTASDIADLKTLADGTADFDYTIQTGPAKGKVTRDRTLIYSDANRVFIEFNKNMLDIAEQSGLIDGDSRKLWENEFYVPFYRVAEADDGGVRGMNIKGSIVRQQAFKQLKGGKNALNADLLENTLLNWAHLLDASAKNRAAKATIEAAERLGIAAGGNQETLKQMGASINNKNGVVWFMDGGKKRYSLIDNTGEGPYLMTALSALEYAGMRNPVMNAMGTMKHVLTVGVTASPFFKVRNLIRDSVQVIGTGNISYNPAANISQGWKLTDPKSDDYFRLLAGGGTIHFGTMYEGNEAKRVQALVESGVDKSTILDSEHKVKAFYRKFIEPGITAYNELGNRGEAINRAALYDQLIKQGVSHADASLQARDLMDFSMQGSFTSIRFLTQVVPFMNARLVGLYKLGRAAKTDPQRMAIVLGATTMAALSLLWAYSDDDDWRKREEWDRNNFFWFKFGGVAFRIPRPFEIGAIATLAERGWELAFDKEMTGKRFNKQVMTILGDNLSMNPVPQLVKPLMDVYANKDSFSGRPIESMGMDKLQSEYRFTDRTSMTARAASTSLNALTGMVGKESLSPVQIDHMLRGYFGWLGSFVVGSADIIARPVTGQNEHPSSDMWKAVTGSMASDLRDAPSRYVSQMYEQARELEQAYGTWRSLQKEGKTLEAQEFAQDNRDKLAKYRSIEGVKRAEVKFNERIRMIERSNMDAAAKRDLIRTINAQKERIARSVVEVR